MSWSEFDDDSAVIRSSWCFKVEEKHSVGNLKAIQSRRLYFLSFTRSRAVHPEVCLGPIP